jgi:hypothetical protein
MFEDWKRAWREAVENFQREVQGGDEHLPPRVRAMERELVTASGALARLDQEIRRARRDLEAEQESLTICRRREHFAREAGDEETVRIALEFAARHEERIGLLSRKAAVLEDERSLLDRDISEMRKLVAEAAPADPAGTVGGGVPSGAPPPGPPALLPTTTCSTRMPRHAPATSPASSGRPANVPPPNASRN